jgi:hypothetical protein
MIAAQREGLLALLYARKCSYAIIADLTDGRVLLVMFLNELRAREILIRGSPSPNAWSRLDKGRMFLISIKPLMPRDPKRKGIALVRAIIYLTQ